MKKLPLFSYRRDGHQPYSRALDTHYKDSLLKVPLCLDSGRSFGHGHDHSYLPRLTLDTVSHLLEVFLPSISLIFSFNFLPS